MTFLPLLCFVLLAGCGSDSGEQNGGDRDRDAAIRPPPTVEELWSSEVIAAGGVGLHADLALGENGPVVAYYATSSRDGDPCYQEQSVDPKPRMLWDLYFAQQSGGQWQADLVAEVLGEGSPPGLDLAVGPDAEPAIAAVGGEPIETLAYHFCGGNDLALYERQGGDWAPEIAVTTSGEAASGQPGSDAGEVVGYWPALAFDANGQAAIAYRDVHYAVQQSDDFQRADLELALGSNGSWRALPVDVGGGAGEHNALVFDGQGRMVIAYYQPDTRSGPGQGVWVVRSEDGGASWQRVRLYSGPTRPRPDLAVDPDDGTLYVVYYSSNRRLPYLATLVDEDNFESESEGWSQQSFGDPLYEEGAYTSIAVDGQGNIGVAYYRCLRATESGDSCPASDNALVFAWRLPGDAGVWEVETVDEGDRAGECGTHASLVFESDGSVAIAYLCQAMVDDTLEDRLLLARRKAL